MVRLALVMIPLIALAGCQRENPAFCMNPDNAGIQGCPGDANRGGSCQSDNDCTTMPNFPACDTATKTCVECFGSTVARCTGDKPRCENDTCVACSDSTRDCGQGGLCLLSGACVAANAIIHAASTSTKTSACGDAATPCSLNGAIGIATATRNVIKLDDPGTFTGNGGFIITADVTIDARGAILNRSDNGPIVTIDGKKLTIYGGTIRGTAGRASDGIKCSNSGTLTMLETKIDTNDLSGINSDTCTLNITKATINNNSQKSSTYQPGIDVNSGSITLSQSRIDSNNGGGLSITGTVPTFVVVGNVLSNNGPPGTPNPPSPVGGVYISVSANMTDHLEFNTIVDNNAQTGGNAPGVHCIASGFATRNNIIWNNNANLAAQTGGNCVHSYSDLGFLSVDVNNNLHSDPMLEPDFHLKAGSPVLGKADPSSQLIDVAAKDIDDEMRFVRAGMGPDIGADQYYPP